MQKIKVYFLKASQPGYGYVFDPVALKSEYLHGFVSTSVKFAYHNKPEAAGAIYIQ